MRNKSVLLLSLALFLILSLPPPASPVTELCPGPAVRIIPPPAEQTEPEEAAEPPPEVHVIEECTVTWYTADTCGKPPDHPAYGITASGAPEEETCDG